MTVEREKCRWSLSWSGWECGEGNVVFQKPLHGTKFCVASKSLYWDGGRETNGMAGMVRDNLVERILHHMYVVGR